MSKIKGLISTVSYLNSLKAVTDAYTALNKTVNLGITKATPILVKK